MRSLGAIAFGVCACAAGASDDGVSKGSTGSAGRGGASNTTSTDTVSVGSGTAGSGGACNSVVLEASAKILPADIIFIVDNSGSMTSEIIGVEQNINVNFASIIQSSAVDYRVIMLTHHGADWYDVCVGPPLSNTTNCAGPPVNVPGQFYHYSVLVWSHDSVCKIFDTLFGPNGGGETDQFNLQPDGWNAWLRTEAVKVFVEITDDGILCSHGNVSYDDADQSAQGQAFALAFDDELLQMAPAQFGTPSQRNYRFYSIVGLPPKPNPLDAYTEFEPVELGTCLGGEAPGTGYQWLSKATGALRFPVCQDQAPTFDAVFQDIAAGVIEATKVPCAFDLPEAPAGQTYDLETIDVLYSPGGGGPTLTFTQVDSATQCGPGKFYVEGTNQVVLCPEACALVEADDAAKLEVRIACGFVPL